MSESELTRAERRRQERAAKSAASKIQAASEANEIGLTSPVLSEWLERLRSLPVDAPEWDDAPAFADAMMCIHAEKLAEHVLALEQAFREELDEAAASFSDELRYLEIDVSTWPADMAMRPWIVPQAQALAPELRSALQAYHEVRPQAATRSEELQRAGERSDREAKVLEIVDSWSELMSIPEEPDDTDAQEPAETAPSGELQLLQAENARLRADNTRLEQERNKLTPENARLAQARETLQLSYDKLRMEKDEQSETNSLLKSELHELKQRVHEMRLAFQQQTSDGEAEQPPITNVRDAIDAARRMFPDTLQVALNSASKEDTPYKRPGEVYDALQWLATEYHGLRTDPPGADPEYDRRLKEACNGWSFSIKQSDTAKNKFATEYETTANGRTYTLDAHIGEGTKGNPQNMVRIAFAWDADIEKVIVGYIGPHQRTQAS